MAFPPPLPPNRPTSGRHSNPNTLSYQNLSPRHSWAGATNYGADPSPQHGGVSLPAPLHGPLPVSPYHGPPPVPTSARPPLPPTPTASQVPGFFGLSGSMTLFPSEDEKFTLTELVDDYSSIFPIKVCVVKGFYGDRGEDCAIAVDELYHFHFVKRSMVVTISDVSKNKYVVPLNSSAKFGVLYEHGTMVFGTVEEVMNAKSLPRVLGVGAGYVGNTAESSVHKHEVLVVKGVEKGGIFRRKPPTLKVFSITKNIEKNLAKEVYGKFSTDPFCVQMYLPEFLKHLPDVIPTQARLYLDFESDDPLPDFLTSESITMERLYVETSIIATPLSEEDIEQNITSGDTETVDIPISLAIEVSVIPPAEDNDYEKLTYDTMNLLTHFDPSATTTHPAVENDNEDDDDYSAVAQNHFFKSVRKGFENEGLNIETPTKIRSLTLQKAREDGNDSRSSSREDSEGYEDMSELPTSPRDSTPPLPLPYQVPTSPTRNSAPPPTTPRPASTTPPTPRRQIPSPTVPPSPPQRPAHTLTGDSRSADIAKTPDNHKPVQFLAVEPGKVPPVLPSTTLPSRLIKRPLSASNSMTLTSPPPVAPRRPPVKKQSSDPLPTHVSSTRAKLSKTPAVLPEIYENSPHVIDTTDTTDTVDTHDTRDLSRTVSTKALDTMQSALSDLSTRVKGLEKQSSVGNNGAELSDVLSRLERESSLTERLDRDVQSLKEGMVEIRERLETLAGQVGKGGSDGGGKGGGTEGYGGESGNSELAVLDGGQIQKLLDLIGLAKYQQNFREAGIDGDILGQCNDQILMEDLSVTSRLDRLKLLQVISGKRSARSILQKSYVAFQPRN